MRTTVTIDPDVEQLLKDFMHRHRTSFKAALNEAVRRGMAEAAPEDPKLYQVEATDLGLRDGIDPSRLTDFADDLDAERFQRISSDLQAQLRP